MQKNDSKLPICKKFQIYFRKKNQLLIALFSHEHFSEKPSFSICFHQIAKNCPIRHSSFKKSRVKSEKKLENVGDDDDSMQKP